MPSLRSSSVSSLSSEHSFAGNSLRRRGSKDSFPGSSQLSPRSGAEVARRSSRSMSSASSSDLVSGTGLPGSPVAGQVDAVDREPLETLLERDTMPQTSAVRVIVRFRPPLPLDILPPDSLAAARAWEVGKIDKDANIVESSDLQHRFQFDRTLSENAAQEDVFDDVGRRVVDDVLQGYHGTVLAYGQTGSGKTYCMFGPSGQHGPDLQGLVPRAARQVFDYVGPFVGDSSSQSKFVVECNFLEVYCEQLRDLLKPGGAKLQVKELPPKGCFVEGLTHKTVNSVNEVLHVLHAGLKHRSAANTRLNHHSSRSHALFILRVQQQTAEGTVKNGKLTLVDLAGSEKVHKSCSEGQMLEQAKKINSSLSALGNVIDALADRRPHVPYRDSRLTRILQDSLGGNCRTTLLVACSPSGAHFSETLSSLRFAARAKKVYNCARMNVTYACDRQLLSRIVQLRRELAKAQNELERRLGPTDVDTSGNPTESRRLSKESTSAQLTELTERSPRTHSLRRSSTTSTIEQNSLNGDATAAEPIGALTERSSRTHSLRRSSTTSTIDEQNSLNGDATAAEPIGAPAHTLIAQTSFAETGLITSVSGTSLTSLPYHGRVDRLDTDQSYDGQALQLGAQSDLTPSGASREDLAQQDGHRFLRQQQQQQQQRAAAATENSEQRRQRLPSGGEQGVHRLLSRTSASSNAASTVVSSGFSPTVPAQPLRSCSVLPVRSSPFLQHNVGAPDGHAQKLQWLVEATPLIDISHIRQRVLASSASSTSRVACLDEDPLEDNVEGGNGVRQLQMRLELERHRCASLSLELEHRTQDSKELLKRLESAEAGPQTVIVSSLASARVSMPVLPSVTASEPHLAGVAYQTSSSPRVAQLGSVRCRQIVGNIGRTPTVSPLRVALSTLTPRTGSAFTPRNRAGNSPPAPKVGRHLYSPSIGPSGRSISPRSNEVLSQPSVTSRGTISRAMASPRTHSMAVSANTSPRTSSIALSGGPRSPSLSQIGSTETAI